MGRQHSSSGVPPWSVVLGTAWLPGLDGRHLTDVKASEVPRSARSGVARLNILFSYESVYVARTLESTDFRNLLDQRQEAGMGSYVSK